MANANRTLNNILTVIDKDVKRLKAIGKIDKLPPADALTLSRYMSSLSDIIKEKEKEVSKVKAKINAMSTDELIAQLKGQKPV